MCLCVLWSYITVGMVKRCLFWNCTDRISGRKATFRILNPYFFIQFSKRLFVLRIDVARINNKNNVSLCLFHVDVYAPSRVVIDCRSFFD